MDDQVNQKAAGHELQALAEKTIEKEEIIKRLKENSKVSRASLPRDIDFSIKDSVLSMFINLPTDNMQENSAAFEGWALILKTWLPNEIQCVELDFEVPIDLKNSCGSSRGGHYNRFLYRINTMSTLYDWLYVNKSKASIVREFMEWIKPGICVLNHPSKERVSVIETKSMERQVESWFVFHGGKKLLCEHKDWDIDINKLFNQLPVGVFYEKIAEKNAVFTGGSSAVDMWGIGNDGQTLHLIELKWGGNKKIGVISETLFYSAVIYDSCVAEDGLFALGKIEKSADTEYADTEDMVAIRNNDNKFGSLFVHILSEQFHPLFNDEVEAVIREGLSKIGIKFDRARYDYSKKVMINENNGL